MTFHLMFVHIILISGWVAEWPPFGKELLIRLTICYLCSLTICKSNRKAMNRKWSNQKANPALKTKTGNK